MNDYYIVSVLSLIKIELHLNLQWLRIIIIERVRNTRAYTHFTLIKDIHKFEN